MFHLYSVNLYLNQGVVFEKIGHFVIHFKSLLRCFHLNPQSFHLVNHDQFQPGFSWVFLQVVLKKCGIGFCDASRLQCELQLSGENPFDGFKQTNFRNPEVPFISAFPFFKITLDVKATSSNKIVGEFHVHGAKQGDFHFA